MVMTVAVPPGPPSIDGATVRAALFGGATGRKSLFGSAPAFTSRTRCAPFLAHGIDLEQVALGADLTGDAAVLDHQRPLADHAGRRLARPDPAAAVGARLGGSLQGDGDVRKKLQRHGGRQAAVDDLECVDGDELLAQRSPPRFRPPRRAARAEASRGHRPRRDRPGPCRAPGSPRAPSGAFRSATTSESLHGHWLGVRAMLSCRGYHLVSDGHVERPDGVKRRGRKHPAPGSAGTAVAGSGGKPPTPPPPAPHFGESTITIWRPSRRGSLSTLAIACVSSLTW